MDLAYLYDTYGIFLFVSIALLVFLIACKLSKNSIENNAQAYEKRSQDTLKEISDELNKMMGKPYCDASTIDAFTVRKELTSTKALIEQYERELIRKDKVINAKDELLERTVKEKDAKIASITREKNLELERRNSEFEKMLEGNLKSMPYLAGMMADYLTYDIEVLAKHLDWGADQKRLKKVKDIREIRKEASDRIEAAKEAEYQLAYLLEIYPELQDIIETDYRDIFVANSIEDYSENYDNTRRYLNRDEWDRLSESDRNQLALDRYIESRSKNKWQIGRDYEESVAYNMYELDGWNAEPTGITQKLEDMGRDIIAKKGRAVDIVQCKYWSKDKVIHEKHVFQLFGTTILYMMDHRGEGLIITPVFVTNIELSPVAREAARFLKVKVIENYPMHSFPRIKCNIGRDEYGLQTKIYHLPMDQQYDNVLIDYSKGEFRAFTVREAEMKGFRRAYRWHENN